MVPPNALDSAGLHNAIFLMYGGEDGIPHYDHVQADSVKGVLLERCGTTLLTAAQRTRKTKLQLLHHNAPHRPGGTISAPALAGAGRCPGRAR